MLMKEYYGENEAAFRRFLELTGREALFAGTREYPQLAGIVDAIMDEMRVKKSFYVEKVRGLLTALLFEIARIRRGRRLRMSRIQESSGRSAKPCAMWTGITRNPCGSGIWRKPAASARLISEGCFMSISI
jgi:hypothetical protein